MRTSRVSQDTAKLLAGASSTKSPTSASSPQRRVTRASLARFSYKTAASTTATNGTDIEDAVPDMVSAAKRTTVAVSRKRKHESPATTTSVAKSVSATTSAGRRTRVKVAKREEEVTIKQEIKEEEEEASEQETEISKNDPSSTTTTSAARRKPARRTVDPSTGETITLPPTDWERVYDLVRAMRQAPDGIASSAPVDTMGCERLADPSAPRRDQRFQTLVALMLSSQTKDTANAMVMRRLQSSLPAAAAAADDDDESSKPGLTLENMLAVAPADLTALLYGVGFHNNKTRYLKQTAEILRDRFASDIPDTLEGLTSLPGVGPKMAHLCLSAAWDRTEGIGVDVHVHRITNLWRWHSASVSSSSSKSNNKKGSSSNSSSSSGGSGSLGSTAPITTKQPEDTRRALEAWLPRDRWREINVLLVGLGQTVCLPQGRRCGDCEVGLAGLCPAADRAKVGEGRRRREREGRTGKKLLREDKEEEEDEGKDVVKMEEVVAKVKVEEET